MATEKQIRANRENAKKSTGPRSAAGRARSARNSLRHGAYARSIVLDIESRERFDHLLADFAKSIQPRNIVELSLVQDMAVARWHQIRICAMEKAVISSEIENLNLDHPDPATRAASAFRSIVDNSRYLDVMGRKRGSSLPPVRARPRPPREVAPAAKRKKLISPNEAKENQSFQSHRLSVNPMRLIGWRPPQRSTGRHWCAEY